MQLGAVAFLHGRRISNIFAASLAIQIIRIHRFFCPGPLSPLLWDVERLLRSLVVVKLAEDLHSKLKFVDILPVTGARSRLRTHPPNWHSLNLNQLESLRYASSSWPLGLNILDFNVAGYGGEAGASCYCC